MLTQSLEKLLIIYISNSEPKSESTKSSLSLALPTKVLFNSTPLSKESKRLKFGGFTGLICQGIKVLEPNDEETHSAVQ